ncbi:MAG: NAD(P)H-dependent oxidoreductase subunit E, partial [Rhodospirillales bacterium]|nr:NAD(P)H-dependent oxidoreductase subunit E [Rhodospirillales bacterium]
MSQSNGSGGAVERRIHPGSGRRSAPLFAKGRRLDGDDQAAVHDLLGARPRQRDLLIEYLHLIQDAEGCLRAGRLQALAEEMGLPMAEVYEVASFYAHFDIVLDGEDAPPPVTVRVCDSLSCELAGAQRLLADLPAALGAGVRVVRAPCMGRCDRAPVCEAGHRHVETATIESVGATVAAGNFDPVVPDYEDYAAYIAKGGYRVLRECREGRLTVEQVIEVLGEAGKRGLGGAGFPTGRKWSLVRAEPAPRLMAVNADEGEPGTLKDRYYLERSPHQFLEGVLIGAWAV